MGRKPTGRKRTEQLGTKFSKAEKAELIKLAKDAEETQADFILDKCRKKD